VKAVFQYQGLISENYKQILRENISEMEFVFLEKSGDDMLIKEIGDADILVGYSISAEIMEAAKKLRHIQIPWTGFNRLGKEFLKDRNVTVSNSHANSLAIAEHALALLTSAAKLITQRDHGMRVNDWSTRYEGVDSVWLTGKTTAIIGYGSIGKKVARMMKAAFNNRIIAVKRTKAEPDGIAEFIGGMEDLERIIPEADFILVATPLTEETKNLVNETHFKLMKKTAVLVNIARGEVVNEEALYLALKDKQIHSAGIDTWYNYPRGEVRIVGQNYPFFLLENIVMTPHSAFKILEREEVFLSDIITNLKRVANGEEPINQVNLELGY